MPRHTRPSERGMTLLEVVLAAVLISLATATIAGAVGLAERSQSVQADRLAAVEVANRLMLMYVDEAAQFKTPGAIPYEIGYGNNERQRMFHWDMDETPVRFELGDAARENAGNDNPLLQRVKQVTVRVWLSESSGGASSWTTDVPNATLTRLIDPLNFDNPDKAARLGDDRNMAQLMEDLLRATGGVYEEDEEGGNGNTQPTNAQSTGGTTP